MLEIYKIRTEDVPGEMRTPLDVYPLDRRAVHPEVR